MPPSTIPLFRQRRTLKPAAMDPERAIPRELILDILEDAHWAPTHGLTQPWRFHVFADRTSRADLAAALTDLYDRDTPADRRDEGKRTKLGFGPNRAPAVVALAARIEPHGKIPEWEELAALACAAQNLMLSAHARGLGSFWSTPPVACGRKFAAWLGHDSDHRALGLIYLGWPIPGDPAPRSVRSPLAEHVVWHNAER